MRTYSVSLAANEVFTVAGGNSFHLITAGAGIDVQYLKADLTDINETAKDVVSGYFVRYPEKLIDDIDPKSGRLISVDVGGFALVKITNGATPQTIEFGVARDGEGGYNITSSVVTGGVLDTIREIENHNQIIRDTSFTGHIVASAGAGVKPIAQLINPVGSGKRLELFRCLASHLTTGAISNTSVWLVGEDNVTDRTGGGAVFPVRSMNIKPNPNWSAANVGELRIGSNAVITGTEIIGVGFSTASNIYEMIDKENPIVIEPGCKVYLTATVNGFDFNATFQWEEKNL